MGHGTSIRLHKPAPCICRTCLHCHAPHACALFMAAAADDAAAAPAPAAGHQGRPVMKALKPHNSRSKYKQSVVVALAGGTSIHSRGGRCMLIQGWLQGIGIRQFLMAACSCAAEDLPVNECSCYGQLSSLLLRPWRLSLPGLRPWGLSLPGLRPERRLSLALRLGVMLRTKWRLIISAIKR